MRMPALIVLAAMACRGALAADAPATLKPGPGMEAASGYCNACHTSDYIIMNSLFLSPAAWKAEVTKMRTAFGGPIDDDVAAEITAYLTTNYAVAVKP